MKNVLGTRMRKSRTPASFVPKPLRNCSLKNPETLLLESTKKTFGTHKKQCFGNRCRQPSRKACVRCLWRSGSDRLTQRKKSHGGAPSSSPPPFDHNQKSCPSHARTPAGFVPKPLRNCSRKNPETSLLEPTKNKEIVPKPCETAARKMPKRCFWNLLKTKKKSCLKVFGTRVRKSRTPAGFVPKPLRNCSRKNLETSLWEPTKNKEIVPKPCETAARKMPKRCFWND